MRLFYSLNEEPPLPARAYIHAGQGQKKPSDSRRRQVPSQETSNPWLDLPPMGEQANMPAALNRQQFRTLKPGRQRFSMSERHSFVLRSVNDQDRRVYLLLRIRERHP